MTYCVPLGLAHSDFLGWDEADQDKALAYMAAEADRCPGCDLPLSESTEHTHRDQWAAESVLCHGCKTLHHAQVTSRDQGADTSGVLWTVRRR